MRSAFILLFWRPTGPTNLTVSQMIVFFPLSRYFYKRAHCLFLIVISEPQDSVRSVARQNRGMYRLRMIVKVALLPKLATFAS